VELGLALKGAAQGPGRHRGAGGVSLALPLGLAGGYYGYILPGDRLSAGGYEALPASGRLGGAAAGSIVTYFRRLAGRRPR
jgi:hypothetical protein